MTFRKISGVAMMVGLLPLGALAQDYIIGQEEYMNSCAQCHGADGKGQGVMAGFLTSQPTDLTQLQKDNNGVFPVNAMYQIIEGSGTASAHGTADMPAWGWRFDAQAPRMLGNDFTRKNQETFVRGRILALVEYISSIQEN